MVKSLSTQRIWYGVMEGAGAPEKMCLQCGRFGVREQGLAKPVGPVGQISASERNSVGDESLQKC